MKFIDETKIFVEAGHGGNGCLSFRREKFVPKGGPDGGDGGDGGSVFLVGKKELTTLYDLKIKPHYRAGRGQHGKGKKMNGRNGCDIFISVPFGVVVMEDGKAIGEIMPGQEKLLVARGGQGGRGNVHFVSAIQRAPRRVEPGKPGEIRNLKIVLKLISDVGIVGLPNAGKSTLLNAITRARSRTGDYPFTTLDPNLGVLQDGIKSIVIADMPGIIEGAHKGRGLGLKFLRHIERTKRLILLIDISTADPLAQYHCLLTEFARYNDQLLDKPRLVVFNKIDLIAQIPRFRLTEETFYISALRGDGIKELLKCLSR